MTQCEVLDDAEARELYDEIMVYSMVQREAFAHIYGGDAAYTRLYNVLGIPQQRPPFASNTDYSRSGDEVIAAVIGNCKSVTSQFSGEVSNTPLAVLARRTYDQL